jgi:FtsZ-binding cell division protein ZapB
MWDINRDDKRTVEAKCPQCGQLMANIGLDFEAPKMENVKAWEHIKTLYSVGITFHSCGCSGPGYIPNSKEKLVDYLNEQRNVALDNLNFWRCRVESTNSSEQNRDISKNWKYISKVPNELMTKKRKVRNEDAVNFWIERLKELDGKIERITTATNSFMQ